MCCTSLVQPYHNRGHDLYSPLLAIELSKVGITITGTVQCNRKGLPKDVTTKKKQGTDWNCEGSSLRIHTCPFMDGQKEGPDDYNQA